MDSTESLSSPRGLLNNTYAEPMTRYLVLALVLIVTAASLTGCDGIADLDVENENDPTRSDVQSAADLEQLLAGSTAQTFQVTVSDWGPHMDLLADQTTSTNAFRSFWDFADPELRQLNNSTTYATPAIFADPYSNLNSGQTGANTVLATIESGEFSGDAQTAAKLRAGAYLTRGVARGYLGLVYNQAFVVPAGADDPTQLELSPYTAVIDSAVSDLETAIEIAENNDFTWDLLVGNTYSASEFSAIANSMAAKISIGEARTRKELESFSAQRLQKIIDFAENGVGGSSGLSSFTPTSTSETFVHNLADWSTLIVPGPAGYLPMDVKISHLLDPSYPTEYPGEDANLDPHVTPDPRGQAGGYFGYTTAFGFLSQARNKSLFSNYFRLRYEGGNNWLNFDGVPVAIATNAEMQYIKAEAHLIRGEVSDAATALQNSPFGDVPTVYESDLPILSRAGDVTFADAYALNENSIAAGRTIDASASEAEFVRALHTEYSVELDLSAGIGAQWFFMRRHDLLVPGVALQYPLPGEEIEIVGDVEPYTFGGPGNINQPGTAGGESGSATPWTSWKDFDSVTGVDAPVGFSTNAEAQQSRVTVEEKEEKVIPSIPLRAGNQ